jgi:uncharacterized OB-fold protein
MLQHCTACDRWSLPVRERCPQRFAAKLEWRQASGRGTLYTFTIMHQVMNPGICLRRPLQRCSGGSDRGCADDVQCRRRR